MFKLDIVGVRTPMDVGADSGELRIKVSVLPLRLLIDGDALEVVLRFQSFFAKEDDPQEPPTDANSSNSTSSSGPGVFIQLCEIDPISIRCDFKPKRNPSLSKLRSGAYVEMINLFPLEDAALDLRHVRLSGITGFDRLAKAIINIWAPHVLNSQIPGLVGGVAPVKSIVNLGQGVADLVLLPVQSYRQDGTVMRGLQKGAQSFARNTAMETLNIGTKLAMGAQVVLEQADAFLSGQRHAYDEAMDEYDTDAVLPAISRYSEQPRDLQEGFSLAAKSLHKHFSAAARTVLAVPTEIYESDGSQGPANAVIRAVPVAVLRPMIGAADAVGKTLLGLRNSLDPDNRMKSEDVSGTVYFIQTYFDPAWLPHRYI
ncbi:autophagy- protein 2 [Gonapodya sp. JEL0774]|nr:autophagy- protein 2 [Gonapodya sp. JEL0774]